MGVEVYLHVLKCTPGAAGTYVSPGHRLLVVLVQMLSAFTCLALALQEPLFYTLELDLGGDQAANAAPACPEQL